MDNKRPLIAHLSMFFASTFWGLMAPIGKDAMLHGITGIDLVTFRVVGAALLFWTASFFMPSEHVSRRDIMLLFFAAMVGLVFNQCCYTIGLSITSPVNASIITTTVPIFAMIMAALILKEPVTGKKISGIILGCSGAVILILTTASASTGKSGDIRGDLLCLFAQFSFALYLSLFNHLIRRYSVITINKWMFTYATILIVPFSFSQVTQIPWAAVQTSTWLEVGYVVVFGTFICYILTMIGQQTLRPTVVSIYNYLQPVVAVGVSVLTALGTFGWGQAAAVVLVIVGVRLVTKSKSRMDMQKSAQK